jgi:hypothetical protein
MPGRGLAPTAVTTVEEVAPPPPIPGEPTVAKTGDDSFSSGQALKYQYTITNPSAADGGQNLTGVSVADSLGMDADCSADTLDAGQTMTCKASYTPDNADADAGEVANTATLHANELPAAGVDSNEWTASYIAHPPEVLKEGPAGFSGADQKLPFTYTITNPPGGEQLSNITIHDSLGMSVDCGDLGPDSVTTCTGNYTTTDDGAGLVQPRQHDVRGPAASRSRQHQQQQQPSTPIPVPVAHSDNRGARLPRPPSPRADEVDDPIRASGTSSALVWGATRDRVTESHRWCAR